MVKTCPICNNEIRLLEDADNTFWCSYCADIWDTWELNLAKENPDGFAIWMGEPNNNEEQS